MGGTDIGKIAGLSPYGGPFDVYLEKIGEMPQREVSAPMKWGMRLESPIAEIYEEEVVGFKLASPGFMWRHKSPATCIGGTPDRIYPDGSRVVEIKTANVRQASRWGEPMTDEVPEEYLAQCAWYMMLADAPACDVAVLVGGNDFRVYRLQRDMDLEQSLLELGAKFWRDHVEKFVPPPIDGSQTARAWLESQWRKPLDIYKPATPAVDAIVARLMALDATISGAESEAEVLEHQLRMEIGEASGIKGSWGAILWRYDKHGRVAWKAVAEECGASKDVIEKHRGEAPRVFRPLWRHAP